MKVLPVANYYLALKSVIFSFSKVFGVLLILYFILIIKLEFMLKELLNYQRPLPLFVTWQKSRENSNGKSSVVNAGNLFGFFWQALAVG